MAKRRRRSKSKSRAKPRPRARTKKPATRIRKVRAVRPRTRALQPRTRAVPGPRATLARAAAPRTASLRVRIFDGHRVPFANPKNIFIRIIDGNQTEHMARAFNASDLTFTDLPLFDNFGDNYTVLVSKSGHVNAGFHPVTLSAAVTEVLDLMLIPQPCQFDFTTTAFAALQQTRPQFCTIMSGIETSAAARFDALLDNDPANDFLTGRQAADILNIMTAMSDINLRVGKALDYLKAVIWDGEHGLKADRFFAWADPKLLDQVMLGKEEGHFDREPNPKFFHPGATDSFKENRFGEANVQLTFHGDDRRDVNGLTCVMVEPDIDYFRDLGSHGLLEVLPGFFPDRMTDPRIVYLLRWMAGRRTSGIAEFDPPYALDKVGS
jgi:hypothetical protein